MIAHTVIVGGGTAGWMTAAAIARSLGRNQRVTLIESDAIGTVGVGEATVPSIREFNRYLGLDEAELVAETEGSFKLGIEFVGWGGPDSRYFHPFGFLGPDTSGVDFHHLWLRHRADGGNASIASISPESLAAAAGRFGSKTPHGALNYALHFDASRYAKMLRRHAEAGGVTRIEGDVIAVRRDAESGDIAGIDLADGSSVDGDLFVDCTGFRGLLIEQTLEAGYVDWSRWLPCDRAIAVAGEPCAELPPFTRATARDAGWQWRIPLRHRTGNGYVYASAFVGDEAAERDLIAAIGATPRNEPRRLRFTAGRRRTPWSHNCVAIGLSAGFLEPLESTSIHLIQSAVIRLLALFPHRAIDPVLVRRFNRDTEAEYDGIRDFIIAHYVTARGLDTPFWQAVRDQPPPDTLAERLAAFEATGTILYDRGDLFGPTNWLAVLTGQGVWPRDHHPIAAALPAAQIDETFGQLGQRAAAIARSVPMHGDYLAALTTHARQASFSSRTRS